MTMPEITPFSAAATDRRRFVGALLLLPSVIATPVSARISIPTVLFVCRYGSVKSPITRELFRRRASQRGVRVQAFSRGLQPEAHLGDALRAVVAADGIDPDRDGLHRLTRRDLRRADIAAVFDPLPPGMAARILHDWTDIGSFEQAYASEAPKVMARIDLLLDGIAARTP